MSDDQFTKLSDNLNNRLDKIDSRLANHDESFEKMFKYIEEFRTETNKRFDVQDKKIDDMGGAIAELSAQVRDYHQEMMALSHNFDKLREAILQIAKETGVKLQVEL